jgi:peptidoglycan hydrolase-like protein with peptidoglycan-binding domain
MALRSKLFAGDPKLEAAAVLDSSHIKKGDAGEHVRKIQTALGRLDGAAIAADGLFGPATAAAVLAFKQKRQIINRAYQSQADNIVGKMTMAVLDDEMMKLEGQTSITLESSYCKFVEPIGRNSLFASSTRLKR